MNDKKYSAGFVRLDMTPPLGVDIPGGWNKRAGEGILDPLYINAIAFEEDQRHAVLVVLDMLGLYGRMMTWQEKIAKETGLEAESLMLCCTHSHTAGSVDTPVSDPLYDRWLYRRICDAVTMAIKDCKPVTDVSWAEGMTEGLTFVRRFVMKDGTVMTRPAPDVRDQILCPACENDESLRVIRIHRGEEKEIVLVNFQTHPDNIGGCLYSADFPGAMRNEFEALCENTACVFINGAEGQMVTDDGAAPPVKACPDKARNHGRKLAAAAAKLYDKTVPTGQWGLNYGHAEVSLKTKRDPSRIPEARRILELWDAGKKEEIHPIIKLANYRTAEARQLIKLEENQSDYLHTKVAALSFCGFALAGLPGEPFNEVGKQIRRNSKFPVTCVSCQANASHGYFPTAEAHEQGGYESYNTPYIKGTAELLASAADKLLSTL